MNMKKIALILVSMVVLVACETTNPTKKQSDKNGGTLRLNLGGEISTLFPPKILNYESMAVSTQIYEGLVKLNPQTLEIEPALATRWESNENNTIFTFTIRDNVFFHETPDFKKRKVTVEDVKACFDKLCQLGSNRRNDYSDQFCDKISGVKEGAGNVEGVKILNDSTVQFELKKPFSDFLSFMNIASYVVYPPEVADALASGDFSKAIGTGPFKVKTVKDKENIELVRNENYWKTDAEGYALPYLDGLTYTFSDKTSEINAFREGKLDLIREVPSDQIDHILPSVEEARAGKNNDFNYTSFPGLTIKIISFNFRKEVFNNIDVRKAFNYAINKQHLADSALQGDFKPAHGGIVPTLDIFNNTDFKGYQYDPVKAKEHLAKAGYPNGVGFPEITLHTRSVRVDSIYMGEVVKMLNQNLNINVKFDASVTQSELTNKVRSEGNDLDIYRYGWIADFVSPQNFLQLYAKNNFADYKNETFTKLLEQAAMEQDLNARLNTYKKADQVLIDDAAFIPLLYNDLEFLTTKRVENFKPNPIDYRDFREVYIKEPTND